MRLDHFVTHIHREFDKDMLTFVPDSPTALSQGLGSGHETIADRSLQRRRLLYAHDFRSRALAVARKRRSPSCGGSCLDARCGWRAAVPDPRGQ